MRGAILLLIGAGAFGQSFEAASIKPSPQPDWTKPQYFGAKGGPGTDDPVRYSCTFCSLAGLISQAYGIAEYRLINADKLQEPRFHVAATIPDGTTKEQFRLMLQHLLAERFQLAAHIEQREMKSYVLSVAKGGLKLNPYVEGEPKMVLHHEQMRKRALNVSTVNYTVQGKTMAEFASMLEGYVKGPVTNATGLEGKYDFDIWWSPEAEEDSTGTVPTVFTAVQLAGLKLDWKKGPLDVVVVDRVEKTPTEN